MDTSGWTSISPDDLTDVVRVTEEWGVGWRRVTYGTPPDDSSTETIAALRAVLAPLLDDPVRWMGSEWDNQCIFCGPLPHSPDCAVLHRDELLGR